LALAKANDAKVENKDVAGENVDKIMMARVPRKERLIKNLW
jgi:hypothetical protein